MSEPLRVSIDEFFTKHTRVPFLATLEISTDSTKVKVTPWSSSDGCSCDAALELPRTTIEAVEIADDVHWCCSKGLRVVRVTFVAVHEDILQAAFAALQAKRPNDSGTLQPRLPDSDSRLKPPSKACVEFCSDTDCFALRDLCRSGHSDWACSQWRRCLSCHCEL